MVPFTYSSLLSLLRDFSFRKSLRTFTRSLILFLFFATAGLKSVEAQTNLVDLHGNWKFQIGDDISWSKYEFDDRSWRNLRVPGAWEDQGLPGYDGYAWYRISFDASEDWFGKSLYLDLGRIDDTDEVYLNGELLGKTGTFPPLYQTAYQHFRSYYLPQYKLNTDKPNVVAIRVYDDRLQGGILEGNVAVVGKDEPIPLIDLAGFWQFRTGDNASWSNPSTDNSDWEPLMVPLEWDQQGFAHYDGFAWYSLRFEIDGFRPKGDLFLSMGKIDDIDQVWINGVLVGQTGFMPDQGNFYQSKGEHLMQRNYPIPSGLLKSDGENYIAVRVFDGEYVGGIYEGPIGVFSTSKLDEVEQMNKEWSALKALFNFLGWN